LKKTDPSIVERVYRGGERRRGRQNEEYQNGEQKNQVSEGLERIFRRGLMGICPLDETIKGVGGENQRVW